jgi:Sigma-70, region 4
LLTILRNIFYSSLRKRVREVQDSDGVYARCLTVSGGQEGHLDLQDFRRALAKLPEKQREVLILVGASGHTYEEAAAICEVEIGTIKSRLSRARSKLSSFSLCRTLPSLAISTHARPATLAGSRVEMTRWLPQRGHINRGAGPPQKCCARVEVPWRVDLLTLREQARTRQHKGFPDDRQT